MVSGNTFNMDRSDKFVVWERVNMVSGNTFNIDRSDKFVVWERVNMVSGNTFNIDRSDKFNFCQRVKRLVCIQRTYLSTKMLRDIDKKATKNISAILCENGTLYRVIQNI